MNRRTGRLSNTPKVTQQLSRPITGSSLILKSMLLLLHEAAALLYLFSQVATILDLLISSQRGHFLSPLCLLRKGNSCIVVATYSRGPSTSPSEVRNILATFSFSFFFFLNLGNEGEGHSGLGGEDKDRNTNTVSPTPLLGEHEASVSANTIRVGNSRVILLKLRQETWPGLRRGIPQNKYCTCS